MKRNLVLLIKAIGFIAVFAFLEFLAQPIAYLIAGVITNDYLISVIQILLEVGGALLSIKIFLGRGKFNKIGLSRKIDKKLLIGIIVFSILLNSFMNLIIWGLKGYTFESFIWNEFFIEDVIGSILIGVFAALATGIIEEFPIRGYVFNLFSKKSKLAAVIISALLYVAIHVLYTGFNFIYILGLILFSLCLSFIYILTDNVLYNAAFFAGWTFSNSFIYSTLESEALSPGIIFLINTDKYLLNGGVNGIYGSVIFVIVMLAADIYLFYRLKMKEAN